MGTNYRADLAVGFAFTAGDLFVMLNGRFVTTVRVGEEPSRDPVVTLDGRDINLYEGHDELPVHALFEAVRGALGCTVDKDSLYGEVDIFEDVEGDSLANREDLTGYGWQIRGVFSPAMLAFDLTTGTSEGRMDVGDGISLMRLQNLLPLMDGLDAELQRIGLDTEGRPPGVHILMNVG